MLKRLNMRCINLLSAAVSDGANFVSKRFRGGAFTRTGEAHMIARDKTVAGRIASIKKNSFPKDGSADIPGMSMALIVRPGKKLLVHLDPRWIPLNRKARLAPGDRVVISGPLVKSGNRAVLVAKSVSKKGKKIALLPRERAGR